MAEKRALSPDVEDLSGGAITLSKKTKTSGGEIVIGTVDKLGIKRTSNLQAPIMQLTGHGAEVYSMKFSPDGQTLASGSFDKLIFLWKTFGDCPNYMMLKVGRSDAMRHHVSSMLEYLIRVPSPSQGHKNAVLEVQWTTDGERLLSCSADKTVRGLVASLPATRFALGDHYCGHPVLHEWGQGISCASFYLGSSMGCPNRRSSEEEQRAHQPC